MGSVRVGEAVSVRTRDRAIGATVLELSQDRARCALQDGRNVWVALDSIVPAPPQTVSSLRLGEQDPVPVLGSVRPHSVNSTPTSQRQSQPLKAPDIGEPNTRIDQSIHLGRTRFDALDIVAFVVGVFAGAILTALYAPKGSIVVGGGLGSGWLALRIKRAVIPTKNPTPGRHEKRAHTTTRGIGGAICLALSMVLLPISGLATLIMMVREVVMRDGLGLSWLMVSALVLTASIFMLRFARKVGDE